jgi:hypothetical protein
VGRADLHELRGFATVLPETPGGVCGDVAVVPAVSTAEEEAGILTVARLQPPWYPGDGPYARPC